jgi:hypothetical protein
MPSNLWTAPAPPLLPGTSVAQNTFTSAKDIPEGESTAGGFSIIYGGQLQAGTYIDIEAFGVASNTATPTLILGVYYGLVAGTALAVSAAKTTTTAMSNWEWHLWYTGRVVSVGTSGSIIGSGYWRLPTSLTAWTEFRLPETAPAAVTIDTTVNKQISIGATWSASSASNSITCHSCIVRTHG